MSGAVAEAVQSAYETLSIEIDAPDPYLGNLYLLGQTRPEVQLPQELPGPARQLVGRRLQLGQLVDWVDRQIESQSGGVCYLEAEAGMGKTRLLEEVLAYAQVRHELPDGQV